MEDKEVGELWRSAVQWLEDSVFHGDEMIAVIRKLVEERRVKNRVICKLEHNGYCPHDDDYHVHKARHDYGIDETTWKTS